MATILEIISVILPFDNSLIIKSNILILLIKLANGALFNESEICWKKLIGKALINNKTN